MEKMLILTCTLASLLGLIASQKTFYCNSPGVGNIRDKEFYLVTRRLGESTYQANEHCEFTASADVDNHLYVEIVSSNYTKALLTIKYNGTTVSQRVVSPQSSTFLTRGGFLHVSFSTDNSSSTFQSRQTGVELRVRNVPILSCPPGWFYLDGTCYGRSPTSNFLTFTSAQLACNNMRSNLLILPAGYSSISSLLRQLPPYLTSGTRWVGLTDILYQFRYDWLNGNSVYSTGEISCASGGSHTSCYSSERCATVNYPSSSIYSYFMSRCSDYSDYICSAPLGGTDTFYSVPVNPSVVNPPTNYRTVTVVENVGYSFIGVVILVIIIVCCCKRQRVVEVITVTRTRIFS